MFYDWKPGTNIEYFYRNTDGKVLGAVWQVANQQTIWSSKIYEDKFPFTSDCEKYLGHFVSNERARYSVEKHWNIEDNTLLAHFVDVKNER